MPASDTPQDVVKLACERRDEYQKWLQDNYGKEFEDVQRAINCRTEPIMVIDAAGNEVEDPTRTNVCMPEQWLITRKKKARLTANDPRLNFIGPQGSDEMLPERLTAWAYQMFDRSGERAEHKKGVHQAAAFGFWVSKVFWDKLEFQREYRRQVSRLTRDQLMQHQGAPQDEIQGALAELGPELNPDEISQATAQYGTEIPFQVDLTKYEGPVVKSLFFGDISFDYGAPDFNLSDWWIEEYNETDLWLQKWAKRRYEDPETKQLVPVMDTKAMDELLDMGQHTSDDQDKLYDLKKVLREAINKNESSQRDKKLLRRKKFQIYEMHEADDQGRMWIHWIGNKKVKLGKMPYPWDLFGKSVYTALNLMPNITSPIGDSTPRMLRHLLTLHNSAVGQRTDLISNILRRTYQVARAEDIPIEVLEKVFGRVIVSRTKLEPLTEPDAPQSGWETEAQILRMTAMAAPELNTVDTGSEANPQAGKLATTALLNAKAADTLTLDEVGQVDIYHKEVGEKKLWMFQKAQTEKLQIADKYIKTDGLKQYALSERNGKTVEICIDPYEIQEDIGVEPESGSMLGVDDELRKAGVTQMYQLSLSDPTLNRQYLAAEMAKVNRLDPEKAVNPPPPPQLFPKGISLGINAKLEDLPAPMKTAVWTAAGFPPIPEAAEEEAHRDTLKGVVQMSEAADAADNLDKTPESELPNEGREITPPGMGKKKAGGTNGKPANT